MKFQEEGLDKLAKAESKVEAEADDEGLKLEPAPGQNDEPVTIRNPEDYMDEIEATTDYKTITKKIISFIEENKFELVETFAEKIAEMVIKDFDVNWIKLRVSKPGALRFSKDVGVIIERTSEDYE